MQRFLAPVVSVVLGTGLPVLLQQPVARSAVDGVAIYVTVQDRNGRLVPGLEAGDFKLLDDGVPVDFTTFSANPQPIKAVVMLDMSASMAGSIMRMRQATTRLLSALQPDDRVGIGSFKDDEIAVNPNLTNDPRVLERVLAEELWPGRTSSIWEGIDAAMTALAGETGRRVVLVLSDGANTSKSGVGSALVRKRGPAEGVLVFALGVDDSGVTAELKNVALETGGGVVELSVKQDPRVGMDRIVEELRQQYLLGFTPKALDGRVHALSIQMRDPAMRAKAPKTYLAPPGK